MKPWPRSRLQGSFRATHADPSGTVVRREGGVSSTPRLIDLIIDVSGILDPPSLVELRRTSHPPDSVEYGFAISRRDCARGLHEFCPSRSKRAQGRPGARCTRGLVCKLCIRKRTRAYRFSGNTPAFPAQWFYGLFRALPGDRALLSPSPREALASHELDTSVGVSGPHDFAVRYRRSSFAAIRVHRIPPHVRDDREPPLSSGETARAGSADLPDGESGIFLR